MPGANLSWHRSQRSAASTSVSDMISSTSCNTRSDGFRFSGPASAPSAGGSLTLAKTSKDESLNVLRITKGATARRGCTTAALRPQTDAAAAAMPRCLNSACILTG
eukprot:CAMPEP_0183590288 /NCGR_PEP_ID=MMETSP0371-20130417/164331_1 /TAXON_ID=268820 /ORGANISM="Peridinium aciculiferum, Strain PAER-2" /LENGTH=105 /DNA_ID=CAMNT_0025801679 /DNA_START=70 /DNA_END=383 /DNA_ORIENTATION=+